MILQQLGLQQLGTSFEMTDNGVSHGEGSPNLPGPHGRMNRGDGGLDSTASGTESSNSVTIGRIHGT